MHRNWKELQSDEIYAIWKEYLRTERLAGYDPLNMDIVKSKPMRLTPMEIIKLVEELLDRLEAKELKDGGKLGKRARLAKTLKELHKAFSIQLNELLDLSRETGRDHFSVDKLDDKMEELSYLKKTFINNWCPILNEYEPSE